MRHAPAALVALLPMLAALLLVSAAPSLAAPGDTTWVRTFDEEFINWATPHYGTFTLPSNPGNWSSVIAYMTIACPTTPGDCDPWDRLGWVRVVTPDQGPIEVARFITPYDITIPGGPVTCTWKHNCTTYKSLLHDEVELELYIESWIGGDRGWLITFDIAYVEGTLDPEPYRVVNLWDSDGVEYGNPDNPLSDHVQPITLDIPADVTRVDVRTFTTGHGQGNTYNCAEFCPRLHHLDVNGTAFSHTLWRANCASNVCSPQGGTWSFGRAGWCPGDRAIPWKVDVTSGVTPGQPATFDYFVDPYENLCRPGNPECVSGVTCDDCNYNSTGHTRPSYYIQGQAILYAPRATVVGVESAAGRTGSELILGPNAPNPFDPSTTFAYTIPAAGEVEIIVHDLQGRTIREFRRHHATTGTFSISWDGRDARGRTAAAGVHFYTVRIEGEPETRKMIRIR